MWKITDLVENIRYIAIIYILFTVLKPEAIIFFYPHQLFDLKIVTGLMNIKNCVDLEERNTSC